MNAVALLPIATNSEAAEFGLPYNARTGNLYSGSNVPTLFQAGEDKYYKDLRWAGFNQWLEVGRVVRKGETSTKIMMVVDYTRKDAEGAPKVDAQGETSKGRSVRTVPVFNYEQTDEIDAAKAQEILAAKAERRETKAAKPAMSKRRTKRAA
jgi:antirestriction protein ArdC